jgi:hypothetical protein
MPIELRSWINPQSYSNSYSTAGIAREAAYFTPVPEPVTADPEYISSEAREYEAAGYDLALAEDQWEDGVLYLGLSALSRSSPALVGSPSTIADAVLAYHDLGIGVVTLGSHVTSSRDAELRRETLRLIRQTVTVRDAAADRAA